jgi:hypothetical protein
VRLPTLLVTFLTTSALAASPALATTIVTPDGKVAQPYQTWVNNSYVPTPAGTVVLHLESCPAGASAEWAAACAMPAQNAIYLGREAQYKDRFFHELGHIYDATRMTDPLRQSFEAVIGRHDSWAWTPTSVNPPIEQFAEAYSMCARHKSIKEYAYGMYDYMPSPAEHAKACSVIRRATPAGLRRRA